MLNTMLRAHLHPFLHYKPMTLNSGHLLESPGQLLKTITGEATSWTNDIRMGVGRQEWGQLVKPPTEVLLEVPGGAGLPVVTQKSPNLAVCAWSRCLQKALTFQVTVSLTGFTSHSG